MPSELTGHGVEGKRLHDRQAIIDGLDRTIAVGLRELNVDRSLGEVLLISGREIVHRVIIHRARQNLAAATRLAIRPAVWSHFDSEDISTRPKRCSVARMTSVFD